MSMLFHIQPFRKRIPIIWEGKFFEKRRQNRSYSQYLQSLMHPPVAGILFISASENQFSGKIFSSIFKNIWHRYLILQYTVFDGTLYLAVSTISQVRTESTYSSFTFLNMTLTLKRCLNYDSSAGFIISATFTSLGSNSNVSFFQGTDYDTKLQRQSDKLQSSVHLSKFSQIQSRKRRRIVRRLIVFFRNGILVRRWRRSVTNIRKDLIRAGEQQH